MTIKITVQNKQVLVRRWKYNKDRKRSLPTTLYSVTLYTPPDELPESVITEHCIDSDEQQTYIDFVTNLKNERAQTNAKYSLMTLTDNLNNAKSALTDDDLKVVLTLEEYEELSELVNEIKKLVTKNKNALKRKQAK